MRLVVSFAEVIKRGDGMNALGKTHKGIKRANNEDAYIILSENISCLSNLYIVADGMGGHQAGEVASQNAIKAFCDYVRNKICEKDDILDFLTDGTKYANKQVFEESCGDPTYMGMGTTFTVCTIKKNKGYVSHIGDSRVYIINEDGIKVLTIDHSYVQEMVRAGELTQEEADRHPKKNALTRALGTGTNLQVDGYIFDVKQGDKILMCTDGLTNMIDDDEIKSIVMNSVNLDDATEELIRIANENGGTDNITNILIEIAGDIDGA